MSQATLKSTTTSSGSEQVHTPSRINDDWAWYAPILQEHNWFLDTHHNRIYTTTGGAISKTEISLKIAAQIEYEPEQAVSKPSEDTYTVGSIASFAGAIEAGDIFPLPNGKTVNTDNGFLVITEDAIRFNPVESREEDVEHPRQLQHKSSHLRQQDRNQIPQIDCFGDSPLTFIEPGMASDVKCNEPASTTSPPSPTRSRQKPTERKLNPVEPITPEYTHSVDNSSAIQPNTLEVGDSRELLKRVPTESVQLACFSPRTTSGRTTTILATTFRLNRGTLLCKMCLSNYSGRSNQTGKS